ncbi:hypothetical protein YC2023_081973 [Brassica napus]
MINLIYSDAHDVVLNALLDLRGSRTDSGGGLHFRQAAAIRWRYNRKNHALAMTKEMLCKFVRTQRRGLIERQYGLCLDRDASSSSIQMSDGSDLSSYSFGTHQKGFGKDKDPNFLTLTCVDSQVYSLDWTPEMNQIVSASQQDTLRCSSSMAALSLPSLPNVLISDTCGEAYGLCESKLQSLFLQSLQHLKLLQWFHLDCVEITEMPYI